MFGGKKKEVKPALYTEETCNSCGEKARRPFARGDTVYRDGQSCTKCQSSTMVTAIYGEYPAEKS